MGADGTIVATRIDRVVVYPRGARVVRVGWAGPGVVQVLDLPLTYASDTLRVRPSQGRVVDLAETCTLESAETPSESPDGARMQKAAERALEAAQWRLAAVAERVERMRLLAPSIPPHGPAGLPDAAVVLALHRLAGDRLAALDREHLEAEAAVRQATERLAWSHHHPPTPAPPRFRRGIRFTLVDAGPETALEIEYRVEAARWVPAYRVDLDGAAGGAARARLRSEALVAQASGEDWTEAALSFAFADPQRPTDLPALTGWRIGTPKPPPRSGFRAPPEGLSALFAAFDAGRPSGPVGGASPPSLAAASPPPPAEPDYGALMSLEEEHAEYDEAPVSGGVPDGLHDAVKRKSAGASSGVERMRSAPPPPPQMAPPMSGPPGGAPMPRPAPSAPAMDRSVARGGPPMAAKSALNFGGGGGPGGGGPGSGGFGGGAEGGGGFDQLAVAVAPPEDTGPRVPRHAYLRLAGADEPHRGTLRPVDPLTHLATLVGDHDVQAPAALRRAVAALQAEAARLAHSPAPPGTTAPSGEAWHGLAPAAGRHRVPADGGWHRLVVRTDEAPAERVWRTVPRHSEEVFRTAELVAPAGLPTPTGPLQVYLDGRFATTATLDGRAGGARLHLNLGLDPAVRVVERTARIHQSDKGLVSTSTRVDHEVTLRLRNGNPHPVTVQVFDRLPVPAANVDDVKVTPLESSPEPTATETDPQGERLRGGVRWTLAVPAGAVSEVVWRYRVELPAKLELAGGNRRE